MGPAMLSFSQATGPSASRTLAIAVMLVTPLAVPAVQLVTLDFDTFTTPDTEPGDYVYSPEERDAVYTILNDLFRTDPMDPMGGPFGVTFEILDPLDPPTAFTTSVVKFNSGAFGSSEGIDFRNLDDADDVDVNATGVLGLFVDTPRSPELGGGFWTAEELGSPEAVLMASAQIAAHELGHALGLRHHDAFGPIGSGIGVAASKYSPSYPGPSLIGLTSQHLMGLNSAVSLSADTLLTPSHFSERSALKLMIGAIEGEIGPNPLVVSESEYPGGDAPDDLTMFAMAPIPLFELPIPNTLESPHAWAPLHGGPDSLPGSAGIVIGTIEDRGPGIADTDHFELILDESTRVTVEVISEQNVNTTEVVDPKLAILDSTTGALLPYGSSGMTLTDNQFESTDAILFDVDLPAGTYIVEVFPADADDSGDYELLVYTFPDVEFPLLGDYNDDGRVDAGDYAVWRDAEGEEVPLPNRGPGITGPISGDDYGVWAENYGEFSLDAPEPTSATGVPEPTTAALALLAAAAAGVRRRLA